MKNKDFKKIAREVFDIESDAIKKLSSYLTDDFEKNSELYICLKRKVNNFWHG